MNEQLTAPKGSEKVSVTVELLRGTLEELEREYILAVLASNGGNRTRTAQDLGIGATTLYRKLKRYERETRRRKR